MIPEEATSDLSKATCQGLQHWDTRVVTVFSYAPWNSSGEYTNWGGVFNIHYLVWFSGGVDSLGAFGGKYDF